MKGLQKIVLAGVAALGLSACDERKDFVVKEGTFTCSPAKLIYEQNVFVDAYRLECYNKEGGMLFLTSLSRNESQPTFLCFEKDKCVNLYSKETMPK